MCSMLNGAYNHFEQQQKRKKNLLLCHCLHSRLFYYFISAWYLVVDCCNSNWLRYFRIGSQIITWLCTFYSMAFVLCMRFSLYECLDFEMDEWLRNSAYCTFHGLRRGTRCCEMVVFRRVFVCSSLCTVFLFLWLYFIYKIGLIQLLNLNTVDKR